MGWWGAGANEDNEGLQLGPFRVGSLAILLFDVLSEILTSCEAVCFFFLPEARLGCGLDAWEAWRGWMHGMIIPQTPR